MTTIARTTTVPFFEQAFEKIEEFTREYHARRTQRTALLMLVDMDAGRLDDLGLSAQDVVEALSVPPPASRVLENRRSARADR